MEPLVAGKLFLVSTPIGNLEDITLRAVRVLKEVDLIACEDTRHTARLLSHYGITTPRESYHEHNEASRTPQLLDQLRAGKNIALVSDAGTPLISDPGHTLIASCRREGLDVVPIPGASAAIAALSGSGLATGNFYFVGFLPARSSPRQRKLQALAGNPATLLFYEAPHRILATLEDIAAAFGPRHACLARELTKLHEEWITGTVDAILDQLKARATVRGEITLVIEGYQESSDAVDRESALLEAVEDEMRKTGFSQNEALKAVARRRGLSRREAYRKLLDEKNPSG
jgi:16S rRNA (cytidine1402-2'-O)-methyltransferase